MTMNSSWISIIGQNELECPFYSVVKLLLEHKVDVNLKNKKDETAAHLAVNADRFETLKLLLKHKNFNPNVQNSLKQTILHSG